MPAKVSCRTIWKVFGPNPQETVSKIEDIEKEERGNPVDIQSDHGQTKGSTLDHTGHVVAVREVSFDVAEGETFVVMGLSGSGKSTLLRCISRLIEPTRGQILIDGADIGPMTAEELRQIRRHKMSMVFQNFGLFPHRKVIDNVAYGLEIQGIGRKERYAAAYQVLEVVNLKGWEEHYPSQLSGGMQQRVGLARALAVDPEILLFDEPFSALDPLIRRGMQDELCNLQNQINKTLIFITHDFAEALRLGDRIAIMKDGAFVQVGTPEEVLLHPATDYVHEFTKDAPRSMVLTARSIMQPLPTSASDASTIGRGIPATTKLEALIPILAQSDEPAAVIDENETVIGMVDRTAIMLALAE